MLRNITKWSFVLALCCLPYTQMHALDSEQERSAIERADIIQKPQRFTGNKVLEHGLATALGLISAPRISGCDETTGFVRLRGVPLCAFDRVDSDKAERAPSTMKYSLLVEKGLEQHATAFAKNVEHVFDASLGWRRAGLTFARVHDGEDFTIILAQPRAVDRLCRPLRTLGQVSCAISGRAIINAKRWLEGAGPWGDDIAGYRYYLINHEVGHLLGLSHAKCPEAGAPAPIMLQQTLDLGTCIANGTVTSVDLAMLRQYLPILRNRLASKGFDRLKVRPRLAAKKKKRRITSQRKPRWVPSRPPGYAFAFKVTAGD